MPSGSNAASSSTAAVQENPIVHSSESKARAEKLREEEKANSYTLDQHKNPSIVSDSSSGTNAPKSPRHSKPSNASSFSRAPISSAPERGPVVTSTNPRLIFLPNSTTMVPNPFFETMPAPEVWHRNMPNRFPFGETPAMARLYSARIEKDLAEAHGGPRRNERDRSAEDTNEERENLPAPQKWLQGTSSSVRYPGREWEVEKEWRTRDMEG